MTERIAIIGLGYVGLPVALAFAREFDVVVGLDISRERIEELRRGHDRTNEVTEEALRSTTLRLTSDPAEVGEPTFIVVTVPTPIDGNRQPDLSPVRSASEAVGSFLTKGAVVVYESTIYPKITQDVCGPILERTSGLARTDFRLGYSPERINPGDREHTLERTVKVVAGEDEATLDRVARAYEKIIAAGVHRAPSLEVAEAAKVIENTQRDLNIALMNELALIFERMGIDTRDVLAAAGTKWNFLPFAPGLVGGHCIGVDPYYLTHKATMLGYYPQVILAGRRINDGMGAYVASQVVKGLIGEGVNVRGARVTVLGLTFKEDVPDLRNTRVIDIVRELQDYGLQVQVCDPLADSSEAHREYGIDLIDAAEVEPAECVLLAVAHHDYLADGWARISGLLRDHSGVVVDVKGVLPRDTMPDGVRLWRL